MVEEQVGLLRRGKLEDLDVGNLIEEIEGLSISRQHAVTSNLVVVLKRPAQVSVPAAPPFEKLAVVDRRAPAAAAQGV